MIEIFGFLLIFLGFASIFSGIVGIIRFPDFYTKLHAASVIDSASIPLVLVGLVFLQKNSMNSFKLILVILIILILSPVSSHMLAKTGFILDKKNHDK